MAVDVTLLIECCEISLNTDSKEALYLQLNHEIRYQILYKRLIANMRLPASRGLAKEVKLSHNTVQQPLLQLKAEGYLESKTGSSCL